MPAIRTRIAWAAGILLLLIVAASLVVPRLLDQERLRSEAERRLGAVLGVPVTIRGPISLDTGAALAIDVTDVTIGGATGGVPPIAVLGRVRASVSATSLLEGPLRLGEVRIDAPQIRLHVDASGQGNWAALLPRDGASDAAPARAWSLDGLVVEGGRIRYTDARTKADHELSALSLQVGRVELPAPVDVRLRFAAATAGRPLATVETSARVTVDPAAELYRVERLTTDVRLARDSGPLPVRMELASASYAGASGAATLQAFTVRAAGVQVRVDGTAHGLATAPAADLQAVVEPFEPRAVLRTLAVETPPMAGPNALARAAVRGGMRYGDGRVEFTDVIATLDETTLRGRADVTAAAPRRWTFDLTADRVVADRYLKPAALRDESPIELPLEFLRRLDARGSLRIGELVIAGTRVRNAVIDLGAAAPVEQAR